MNISISYNRITSVMTEHLKTKTSNCFVFLAMFYLLSKQYNTISYW